MSNLPQTGRPKLVRGNLVRFDDINQATALFTLGFQVVVKPIVHIKGGHEEGKYVQFETDRYNHVEMDGAVIAKLDAKHLIERYASGELAKADWDNPFLIAMTALVTRTRLINFVHDGDDFSQMAGAGMRLVPLDKGLPLKVAGGHTMNTANLNLAAAYGAAGFPVQPVRKPGSNEVKFLVGESPYVNPPADSERNWNAKGLFNLVTSRGALQNTDHDHPFNYASTAIANRPVVVDFARKRRKIFDIESKSNFGGSERAILHDSRNISESRDSLRRVLGHSKF